MRGQREGQNLFGTKIGKAAICLIILFILCLRCIAIAETVRGDLDSRLNAGSIEREGITYRPKRRLNTILVMGIDKWESEIDTEESYRDGGQADFLALVVIDDNAGTTTIIHVNRDMMAEIIATNLLGETIGTRTAQICLAYGFGDGGKLSCELTAESLSRRFQGIQIDGYIAMRLDGISELNDALGGVQVTLEDDFSMYDPQMTKGTTLRLQGKQAEYYLRYRYFVGDGSNAARLLRQRNYMENAKELLMENLNQSSSYAATLFEAIEPHIVTDMGRGRIINFINRASQYTIFPVVEIEGENIVGESGLYEFYPDEDKLMQILLEVFYEPVE